MTQHTGIVYSPEFACHKTPLGHPECPERAIVIAEALKKSQLPLAWLQPRKASLEELELCHSSEYISLVAKEVKALEGELAFLSTGDVVISPDSMDIALLAAGAVFVAVDAVMEQKNRNCFAIVRPPGHHATHDRGMGFCLFNNVALGARFVQKKYGIKRVLIVDWDLHHGNGTEDIFFNDNSVLYFSTHQERIYPGTGTESHDNIYNIPIRPGSGSKEAIFKAFEQELAPRLDEFQPEFVFISCGFDAHTLDPLGYLLLDDKDFFDLTTTVCTYAQKWSGGKIVSVLEGGYNLSALQSASVAHVRALC